MPDPERLTPSPAIDAFLANVEPRTPCVVIDLAVVRARFQALRALLPDVSIYYAVKANPAAEIIAALADLDCCFDLASPGEMELCAGVASGRLSYGNTIKRERDIVAAFRSGIDLFAFDSEPELRKLARAAPGARVFCRIAVRNAGAEWPLTHKFGCDPRTATDLLINAAAMGLRPTGVSFHVGSQQTDPRQWETPIAHAAEIFRDTARHGVSLALLNLGGGLPALYRTDVPALECYARVIDAALIRHFGASRPRTLIEPGRYMVGDAGVLRAEVLLVTERSGGHRWVYLDAGRYNGLPETLGERIQYRLRTSRDGDATGPVVLAGPTCDSTDILYQRARYELPLALAPGDHVDFMSAGAYTASYASVGFNGFAPLRTWCV
jgi:ornithine decarboxylase